MPSVEQVHALIGDIYDAALDPSRWSSVMAKARDFVGGSAAAVFSKDSATRTLHLYHHCGRLDPHYQQLYFDRYQGLDPSTCAHVLAKVGQPICTADIMDIDEFTRTRFYQEWGRPQDLVDFGAVVLERSATGAALFGVFRQTQHGPVDGGMRRRLQQLAPHIRRTVLISRAIESKAAEAATFADTLDGLSASLFLVDGTGRIVHANAGGQALMAEGAVLRRRCGRLVPADTRAARALEEIFAAGAGGDAAFGVRGIAVALAGRDGERYTAHVLPLAAGERRRAGTAYAATAAVFIRKAGIEAPSPPEIIARHYGLTPTELRVLLGIVQIGGVPETADALGIGEATVKTHLHRLFGKTGATRQADLVKLVAGFSSPIVGACGAP